jgi:SPP1 family predicted phage head-tail adaptor
MRAGELRHSITIEKPTYEQNAYGEQSASWAVHGTDWAKIELAGGSETSVAEGITTKYSYKITIRYRDDLKPSYRILYGSRILSINSIADIGGRSRATLISATEHTDQH